MHNKYQRLVLEGSNDGVNWVVQEPLQYKRGDVIEEDSKDCGGYGGVTQNRWVEIYGEYICINNDKYQKLKKQYLDTATGEWVDVQPLETMQGQLIEQNSAQCGYGEQWVDTGDWGCKEVDEPIVTECGVSALFTDGTYSYMSYDYSIIGDGYGSWGYYGTWQSTVTIKGMGDCITTLSSFSISTLKEIEFSAVTRVLSKAFDGCENLEKVELPNCNYIESSAFIGCGQLKKASFPKCLYVEYEAFDYCRNLSIVNLPNCVSIGSSAFHLCELLESINLPVCRYICSGAFGQCDSLKMVELPNCSYIDKNAFWNCIGLSKVSLPVCISINSCAFYDCSNLKDVYFMGSRIVEWRMSDYASVFSGCHQDLSIHVPTGLYSEYIYKYGEYFVTLHGNVRRGFSKIITSR